MTVSGRFASNIMSSIISEMNDAFHSPLPGDIWIEVAQRVDPSDVVSLMQVRPPASKRIAIIVHHGAGVKIFMHTPIRP